MKDNYFKYFMLGVITCILIKILQVLDKILV